MFSSDVTSTAVNQLKEHYTTQIKRNCFLKTLNQTTNLACSLDGYLWTISALATEKLQVRCVMETHIITIKPPPQIVDIGNGCDAYSARIYVPAKTELTANTTVSNKIPIFP